MLNHEDDVVQSEQQPYETTLLKKGLLDLGDPLNHRFTIGLAWFSLKMFIKKCLMWMIWGYPHFRKPLYIHIYIYIYIHICVYIYKYDIYIYFSRNMPCYHLRFLMGSHTSKLLFPSGFVQKMLDISCNPWVMLCRLFPSTPKGTSTPWQCNATICFDISKQNEESFVTVISDASQCASATCWDEVNWTGQILLTARFESEARPSTGGNFPERINLRTCCDPSHRTCRCTGEVTEILNHLGLESKPVICQSFQYILVTAAYLANSVRSQLSDAQFIPETFCPRLSHAQACWTHSDRWCGQTCWWT
jgi:hypothetical protein